jgi:hypothetical protein
MPQQGAEINIITGEPVLRDQEAAEQERQASHEDRLAKQAQYADLLRSEPGEKLIHILEAHLTQRIVDLVQADPQATAYVKILNELGVREFVGRRATQILMNRYLKRKDADAP